MATYHYFNVKHKEKEIEHLVKAPRASAALAVITGDRAGVKQATNEEIEAHFVAGNTLHEKSLPVGEGKIFFIKGERDVLIRAANAGSAFDAIGDGSYEVTKCDQDTLVRLLTNGLVPKVFEDKPRNAAGEPAAAVAANHGATDEANGDDSDHAAGSAAGEGADDNHEGAVTTANADNGISDAGADAGAVATTVGNVEGEASNDDAGAAADAETSDAA